MEGMRPRAVILSLMAAGSVAIAIAIIASIIGRPHESTGQMSVTTGTLTEPSSAFVEPSSALALASPDEQAALAEAVSNAVNGAVPDTEIGLVVYDQLTEAVLTSVHADQQFYTASVVKLLIVIQVLRDASWEVPTGSEREDLVAMLSRSADGVASRLWGAYGGPAIITEVAALVDLSDTSPPRSPGRWELTRMSPQDVLDIYEYIDNEMPRDAREFILTTLANASNLAADGFDQFFGIPRALPDTEWAIKQGWMQIDNGLVLNTTGIVGSDRRYVVALLTQQPRGTRFEDGCAALTAGIAALAPTLTAGTR
jgi:hypothetical protein